MGYLLGPAAWRPFNPKHLDGFNFEKVAVWSVAASSNGARTASISANGLLVQTAKAPIEYYPIENDQLRAVYANGVELILREKDWIGLGSCPVRFEGETVGLKQATAARWCSARQLLLAGRKVAEIGGYPATFHVRDFLNCVKTRSQPKTNAEPPALPISLATRSTSRCT